MKILKRACSRTLIRPVMIILALVVISVPAESFAHGSEGHDKNAFTNYDAAKKGLQLFDQLLMKKKLDPGWESEFSAIFVKRPAAGDQKNIVVKISRQTGSPENLYIFFDETGNYKGSNFKGD